MKKLLAILLSMLLCVSLMACGGSDIQSTNKGSEQKNRDYASELTQFITENNVWYMPDSDRSTEYMITFFEDGHIEETSYGESHEIFPTWEFVEYYQDASDSPYYSCYEEIPNFDVTRGLYTTDCFLLGFDTEGNPLFRLYYGSVGYSESQYEPIEITLDNWQDYFEFKEYHNFEENGFGEFESASTSYYLITKDEINVDVENSDVTLEYTWEYAKQSYAVDFENKTVTYGEITEKYTSDPQVETMNSIYRKENNAYKYEKYIASESYYELEGNCYSKVTGVDVTRIIGTLYVAK